jgi:TonB-dependent siderophore receptor
LLKGSKKSGTGNASIEEVMVTGSYTTRSMNGATGLEMSLRETPQTVTIMTSQMIEDKALVDMEQVLDHVPGVSKVGDASEYSMVFVRGFQLDTGVQVDGMITTPANSTYSGDLSQSIDPVIAERIEVLKGAAGILGGQGEPSATVNMIRKRPTSDFKSSVSVSGGSWDNYRTEGDISGALNESGSVRGRIVGAYLDGDSYIDRYTRDKSVIYGVIEADLSEQTTVALLADNTEVNASGVYNWSSNPAFYTDGTLIDHEVSYSTGQPWAHRNIKQSSVMPELRHDFGNGWTVKSNYRYATASQDVSNANFGSFVDKVTGAFVDPWSPRPTSLQSDRESDTQSFNLMVNGDFVLFERDHDVVLGHSYSSNEFTMYMSTTYVESLNFYVESTPPAPDYSQSHSRYGNLEEGTQSGTFGTVRFNLADPLKVMVGGRVSDWSYKNTDLIGSAATKRSSENNVVTPYAGLVYDLSDVMSVYTSYTGIFLPVSQYGADGNILEPTEGTNTEAGIKLAFFDNDLNISAAVYRANKDNVSEYANLGRLPNGSYIYESIDGVKTDGYEIEIAGALSEQWKISGGYTHNEAEDKEGNPRQTYIPNEMFKITHSYTFADTWDGLTLGASARWQSDSYYNSSIAASVSTTGEPIDVRQEQPSYWLVDVMARCALNESLSVSLNIDNLFDEFYNRSMWGYADFGEPRSATLGMKYRF